MFEFLRKHGRDSIVLVSGLFVFIMTLVFVFAGRHDIAAWLAALVVVIFIGFILGLTRNKNEQGEVKQGRLS